jgi:hypothetical protein
VNEGKMVKNRSLKAAMQTLLLAVLALIASSTAFAQETTLAKFRGGIGVINVTGATADGVKFNVVRGISPAGPWRIADLDANVRVDGTIKVQGRGLLLAAGDGIGTNAGASVFATLFCGTGGAVSAHSSSRVPLDSDGNFRIDDALVPAVPPTCEAPALLIRNGAGSGVWFAAGIPDSK